MERVTEVELAQRLLAGEPHAFDLFVEHFRAKIFKYSWLMCGQREDAEEVAQETLLSVFERSHQLRDPSQIRPWIYRIARNSCLMKRRKTAAAPVELSLEQFYVGGEKKCGRVEFQVADCSLLPEQELLRAEFRNTVEQAIVRLPGIYRAVVLLRDVEELSTEETAGVLDLSIEVVKARLHRGRLAIRDKLERYLRSVNEPRLARNDGTFI